MNAMDQAQNQTVTLETSDIIRLLPHRYPFLLVDRILEIDGDRSCIGVKNVTFNESIFMGHFPGAPVFPGVLLIEGMAQTAGAICIASKLSENKPPQKVFFMTIDKAKFRKPVMPGDVVRFHMPKLNNRRNMWWYRGEARVDETLVAEAEVSAMMVHE